MLASLVGIHVTLPFVGIVLRVLFVHDTLSGRVVALLGSETV